MIDITYEKIKELYFINKYIFFTGNFNLNLFAIRGKNRISNAFDDTLGVAYQEGKENKIYLLPGTVDPGIPWLKNPMEPKLGAAAIKEGQYKKLWQLGRFRNTTALLQVSPVTCYRDNNKNDVFDFVQERTSTGLYGIFWHEHFQNLETAINVDKSSAGCVVPASRIAHYKVMDLCNKQILSRFGNTFTFTLFDEREI